MSSDKIRDTMYCLLLQEAPAWHPEYRLQPRCLIALDLPRQGDTLLIRRDVHPCGLIVGHDRLEVAGRVDGHNVMVLITPEVADAPQVASFMIKI